MSNCCTYFGSEYGTRCVGRFYLPWTCGDVSEFELTTVQLSNISANKADQVFNQIKEQLKGVRFLPEKSDIDLDFVRLVYLATLDGEKSPFTLEEVEIFKRSFTADRDTRCWLRFGLTGGLLLIAGGCLIGLKAVSDWSDGQSAPLLPIMTSLFFQLTGGFASYVSTGSNPDFASNAANTRQDKLSGLSQIYLRIAKTLVDLKTANPEFAKIIAGALNFDRIKEAIKRDDPKGKTKEEDAEAFGFMTSLSAAVCYVQGTPLPKSSQLDIINYISLKDPAYLAKNCSLPLFVMKEHKGSDLV